MINFIDVAAQIKTVNTLVDDPDHIYFVEEVPLPSTLKGFNAISIFQDRDGFMWFGGESGLLRYDGSRIKEYSFDPNDKTSLRLKRINAIVQDSSGMIWLGTKDGLIRLYPESNTYKQYLSARPQEQDFKKNIVKDLLLDENRIWLATEYGISMFDIPTGTFSRHHKLFNPQESGLGNVTLGISGHSNEELCVRFGKEIYIYDIMKDSLRWIPDAPQGHSKSYTDKEGGIYFPSWTGLFKYLPEDDRFEKVDLNLLQHNIQTGEISSVLQGRDGFYWICTPGGIGMYANNWQPLRFWAFGNFFYSGVTFDQFRAMFIDRSNNLWFSTPGMIHRIVRKPRVFICDTHYPLQRFMIYFTVNDSCYWFSDLNGNLFRVQHDLSMIKEYKLEAENNLPGILPSIDYFIICRSGTMWIGTKNAGIFRIDNILSNEPIFKYPYPGTGRNPDIRGSHVLNFYEDRIGRVWFGVKYNWPSYIDPQSGDLIQIIFDNKEYWFPHEVKVECELGNDVFLASTESGALIFNLSDTMKLKDTLHILNHETYNFQNEEMDRTNYPHQILSTRNKSGQIRLYVISEKGGIQRFIYRPLQAKGGKIVKDLELNTNNGLITNTFWNIVEDKNGILWFGSEDGLVRFNPEQESFTTYTRYQGLEYDEFQIRSVAKGADDRLYYGTDFGLLSFHPDSVILNNTIPPVFITDVKVNGISLLEDSLASVSFFKKDLIRLNYKQNNLSFEFAALNYIHPERNHFKIQLEGVDEDWIPVGNESMYSYYNLKPGKYSFRVIGSNNDDVWNMTGDYFDFFLKKPPWFTWGALLIYLLILSAIFVIYYRYVQYRAKVKMEITKERIEKTSLAEVDELKSRFFANISHEFRTPLTLIMGHVRDLETQSGNEVRMKRSSLAVLGRNARRLLLLINQLLDIAKLEKNALQLDLKKGDLSEWIRVLVSSFQSLADSQEIQFITQIEDPGREVCFDPDKTDKIITNLLSNAFKFTGKGGRIAFQLRYLPGENVDQEHVEILVSDTGKGMNMEQLSKIFDRFYQVSSSNSRDVEGAGIGLSLTKELIDLLKGSITVESEPGEGTTFKLILPVSQKCYPEEKIRDADIPDDTHHYSVSDEAIMENSTEGEAGRANENVILVVEDNPDLRKYLVDQLSTSYTVLEAENGEAGLEVAKNKVPDLVISDLMMPVMSGTEMTALLKQDPATNHIPVIMLTAKADKESKIEGLDTGADDYVIKPFDADELLVRVRNLIHQRELLRNKFTQNFLLDPEIEENSHQFRMLREILGVIKLHLSDPDFNLASFSSELGMSRTQLFRKIRSITSTTPNELVRIVRMKHAARLLRSGHLNVAQVMYEVGMKNPSYFAKSFKKYFGYNPTEFRGQSSAGNSKN
ncbi:response regulator [Bacteroidota bacterium]